MGGLMGGLMGGMMENVRGELYAFHSSTVVYL